MTELGSYRCEVCGCTFNKTRSDEEAYREMLEIWEPHDGDDDPGIVCDPCFVKVLKWAEQNHPEFLRGRHDS